MRIVLLSIVSLVGASAVDAADGVKISDIEGGNARVRLVAVKQGLTRAPSFTVKFETVEKDPKVILITTDYRSFTTHDYTIRELILGCVEPKEENGWQPVAAGVVAIFSIPREGVKRGESLERCFLLSLKIGEKK